MTPQETAGLAASGAVAGLCPITEANLGDGVIPADAYLAAGGAFGVGSDSNVRISLSEELRLLEYSQRLTRRARAVLAAPVRSVGRTLFEGACVGAARALGRDAGAIREGAWADLAALDENALPLQGLAGDAVLDAWIFAGDDSLVTDVWSAGRHQVRGGRHVARDKVEKRYRGTLSALRERL
jgi:formimidoylglutamate deiminase